MKTLICPECGTENEGKAIFCKNCGYYLKKSALEKEFERIKYEIKKFVDERIDEVIYSKVIEMKMIFDRENKKINTILKKISKRNREELKEFKQSFRAEVRPVLKRLKKFEEDHKKLVKIDDLESEIDKNKEELYTLSSDVSEIKKILEKEIKDINTAMKESIEKNVESMVNNFKKKFESRIDAALKKVEEIELEKEKLKSIDSLSSKINENKKRLNELINKISEISETFDRRIDESNADLDQKIKSKFNSLLKKINEIKFNEEKIKNIDVVEKKTEKNLGKIEELTKLITQIFDTLNNVPSQKVFSDSLSKLNQELFALGEKIKNIEESIKRVQKNSETDYLRLETEIKNVRGNADKLEKRIDVILKKVDEIRTSPVKSVLKEQKMLEKRLNQLEKLVNEKMKVVKKPKTKSKPVKNKEIKPVKKIKLKVNEIKDKIVESAELVPSQLENKKLANKTKVQKDIKRKTIQTKEKKEETEGKKILMCRYCHRPFNNQRLLEMHELICEKKS